MIKPFPLAAYQGGLGGARSTLKIKKDSSTFNLELVKTSDILTTLGQKKKAGQILVGFALETDNTSKDWHHTTKSW